MLLRTVVVCCLLASQFGFAVSNCVAQREAVFPLDEGKLAERRKLLAEVAVDDDQNQRPNIVLILADDLGYGDLGLHGSPTIPTPHLDSLGQSGTRFSTAYVTAASCSPSRAGLLTGQYQQRFGFEFNTAGAAITHRLYRGLDPAAITLADVLGQAGYKTAMYGKWHLGTRAHLHPLSRGFSEFYGFLAGAHSFLPATRDEPIHTSILRGRAPIREAEYLTDAIARESVEFIRRHRETPFFLYVPFNAVHTPLEATDTYLDRFPQIESPKQKAYNAMTVALDDAVGRIVGTLKECGVLEQTMVIFVNDNGGPTYTGVQSNGDLRLGKLFLFEGGIRVPMFIRWPQGRRRGLVYEPVVSTLDLFPTVCATAGVSPPASLKLDGVDLARFVGNEAAVAPHEILFWSNGPNLAVRKGQWKLIRSHDHVWLFDLSKDPGEKHNLRDSQPELVKQLMRELNEWRAQMPQPAWPSKPRRRKVPIDDGIYELNI